MPLPEAPQQNDIHELLEPDQAFYGDKVQSLVLEPRKQAATDPQCRDLALEQVQSVKEFWSAFVTYVDERYGNGTRKYLTIDNHYEDVRSPRVCTTSAVIQVKLKDPSSNCDVVNVTAGGNISGTHGIMSLMIQMGLKGTSTYTINEQARIGLRDAFRASIRLPDIVSGREQYTSTASIINSQYASFEVQYEETVTTTFNVTVAENQTCEAVQAVRSCNLQGTGKMPLVVKGKIWVEFEDRTYDHWQFDKKNVTADKKHFKFDVDTEEIKPSLRTLYSTFEGSISTISHEQYKSVCRDDGL
ncbi:hypothetical protein J3R30DRAFT_3701561 [Lentinula aciculospora]|uniref:Uncharacterized protein n=1 Tax=Lentinula aciculospora TaxID=153920 RepID=A0A9W9DPE5_9AGAR|nr:hypothetical protein J3R30DRAFT_3701561 [Lentinula aciculospora]